jgi:O-antigen ligase
MTSIAFIEDPTIARNLASGKVDDEYINSMRMQNVGGYGFSYAVGMFIPYIAIRIVRSTGKIRFVFIALYIALFVYALFCQYTTLLFIVIAFSTIVFIWGSKNTLTKSVLLFVSLLVLINMSGIFKFLGNHIPLASLAYHLKNLYISMSTGEETNSRLLAVKRCLGLFRQHPFFGVNMLDGYNAYIVNHGHASYFPIMASNGAIGLSLLLIMTFVIIKNIYAKINDNKMIVLIYIMYIILGFLNPTHNAFEISVVIFLLIPSIEFYENKIKEQKHAE